MFSTLVTLNMTNTSIASSSYSVISHFKLATLLIVAKWGIIIGNSAGSMHQ
jgi:hypothetical protein